MRPVSQEKRELIIAAKKRGEKESEIALWLDVSVRSVATLWKLYRDSGDVSQKEYKGRRSRLGAMDIERITHGVERCPDMTLNELIENLSLPIRKSQLSRLLIRLGFSLKKRHSIHQTSLGRMSSRGERSGGGY